jgi:hypothetical protein
MEILERTSHSGRTDEREEVMEFMKMVYTWTMVHKPEIIIVILLGVIFLIRGMVEEKEMQEKEERLNRILVGIKEGDIGMIHEARRMAKELGYSKLEVELALQEGKEKGEGGGS